MKVREQLPLPKLDALLMGAHRLSADDAGVPVFTDQALFVQTGVRIAFAGREGGVSVGPYASLNCGLHVGDDEAAVRQNRALLFDALGLTDVFPIIPSQVHGTDILMVGTGDSPDTVQKKALEDGADGLVVDVPGVAALLNFADCLPLIIVSPDGAFAVAHAGWRGAVAHIASKAARLLSQHTGCDSSLFNAYIGPHIRSECFEVGPEVAQRFADEFGRGVLGDDRHVSLAAAVSADLQSTGLAAHRIADAETCTVCNSDRFFSYRASGGTCGRHAALAARVEARAVTRGA